MNTFKNLHDVNVKSKNGIALVIDIYEQNNTQYNSTVTVPDPDNTTTNKRNLVTQCNPKSESASDNFEAAIQLIVEYITKFDKNDTITDIHNPCNCPFVSEADQNNILSQLGVNISVRVN